MPGRQMPTQIVVHDCHRPSAETLKRHIDSRTGRRIRYLRVDCGGGGVTVQGLASCYYVKQLALSAVRELVPDDPVILDIHIG